MQPAQSTTNNTASEERAQPWQQMNEVQNLFKPEVPATLGANGNAGADKVEEEPLKLNLFRTALNAASTNIADVKQ